MTEEFEDTLTLYDVAAVQTDVVGSEVPILNDTTHTRIEESTQSFWNEGRWNLDHYDTLKTVLDDKAHPVTIVLNDATAVDDMLLVASESLAIEDAAVAQTDVVGTEKVAVDETLHERHELATVDPEGDSSEYRLVRFLRAIDVLELDFIDRLDRFVAVWFLVFIEAIEELLRTDEMRCVTQVIHETIDYICLRGRLTARRFPVREWVICRR